MNFYYPFKGSYPITQSFQEHKQRSINNGWCWKPGTCPSGIYYYPGVDYGMPTGTPLYASIDGSCEVKYDSKGYGNYVKQTNGKYIVIYGHMQSVVVKNGQVVKAGELIGYSDNTGNSTGPHLHYEIRENGIPVDPIPLVNGSVPVEPSTPVDPTVPPTPVEFNMPPIPTDIPKGKVVVTGPLNIRDVPVTGKIVGMLYETNMVNVTDRKDIDGNVWLQIGYNQWVAGFYANEIYVSFE